MDYIYDFLLGQSLFISILIDTVFVFISLFAIGFFIGTITDSLYYIFESVLGPTIANILRNYLTYIGTVHHELSHALFCVLTGAKLLKVTLFPHGDVLGSVEFIPRGNFIVRGIQKFFTSIAPVFMGCVTLFLMMIFYYPSVSSVKGYILFGYIFLSILFHMNLSAQDIKVMVSGIIICFVLVYLLLLILSYFDIYLIDAAYAVLRCMAVPMRCL